MLPPVTTLTRSSVSRRQSALRSRGDLSALRRAVTQLPETGRGQLTPGHLDELVGEFNAVLGLMEDYQWRV